MVNKPGNCSEICSILFLQITNKAQQKMSVYLIGHIDGLVQDCNNSIADALELLQSCTKPYIYIIWWCSNTSGACKILAACNNFLLTTDEGCVSLKLRLLISQFYMLLFCKTTCYLPRTTLIFVSRCRSLTVETPVKFLCDVASFFVSFSKLGLVTKQR